MGDVKMMLLVGAFLGCETDATDDLCRLAAGQHPGARVHGSAPQGFRLRIAVWNIFGHGGSASRFFRNADRELVSVDALGAMMSESVDER